MIKFIFILISILVIPGAFIGFRDSIWILFNTSQVFHSVLIGCLIAVLLYYLLLRQFHALNVFEHELTHALVALLFFRRIDFFVASSDGGFVRHRGGFGFTLGYHTTSPLMKPFGTIPEEVLSHLVQTQ